MLMNTVFIESSQASQVMIVICHRLKLQAAEIKNKAEP